MSAAGSAAIRTSVDGFDSFHHTISSSDRLAALRATHELAHCSDHELRALLGHFDELNLAAGSLIARKGDWCSEFAVVVDGRLQATGGRAHVHSLVAGSTLGWDAMWERSMNAETVIAATDVRLLVMSHAQFRAVKALADPSK
jgi:CRP-like cAMP-binding protein